jgi:ribosomal protein S18 acetylase RimI-like enzyme
MASFMAAEIKEVTPLLRVQRRAMTADDEHFVTEFEALRWPLERWHHRDHVKLAYLYLIRYGLAEAAEQLRDGIKAHNAARGIVDSPTGGYHETMTQAWLRLINVVLCEYGPAESADAFCEAHPELSQVKTLRLFYSRERFMSARAKSEFVEPDLAPLPWTEKPVIKLVPITPDVVAAFKDVRLRALQDSPQAFGSTYAKESQFGDDEWLRRSERWATPRRGGWLAMDGDAPCGIVVGDCDRADPTVAWIMSMWVVPTHRRMGAGRRLVEALLRWAVTQDYRVVRLEVVCTNDAAIRFYESMEFVKTGRTCIYPNDPSLFEYEMERRLLHA